MMRTLRVGVAIGIAAGVVMAVWLMVVTWITGSGFWTPLNLVAHTFYRSAPLNATFSAPAMVIGLAVHMTVAGIFGIAIAAFAQRRPAKRSLVIAGGILFVGVVWPVMQYGVWYSLDKMAAGEVTTWIFAFGHLVFGLVAAGMATIAVADDETATRTRQADERTPPPPDPAPGSLFQPGRRR
ncbi:MAG TPA: hypothetical protein VF482_09900 [Trebonia sp.]